MDASAAHVSSTIPHPVLKTHILANKDKRPLVMGIDPGLKGAIAIIDFRDLKIETIIDMPLVKTPKNPKNPKGSKSSKKAREHRVIDIATLALEIDSYVRETAVSYIEHNSSRPGQGLQSTYRFGYVSGLIHGATAALGIPVLSVRPEIWKGHLGLTSDKTTSLNLARKMWPEYANQYFSLKKHSDRAEAALIAFFAVRILGLR